MCQGEEVCASTTYDTQVSVWAKRAKDKEGIWHDTSSFACVNICEHTLRSYKTNHCRLYSLLYVGPLADFWVVSPRHPSNGMKFLFFSKRNLSCCSSMALQRERNLPFAVSNSWVGTRENKETFLFFIIHRTLWEWKFVWANTKMDRLFQICSNLSIYLARNVCLWLLLG